MKEKHRWPNTSIRINPEVLHQGRIAAVTQKKTLGQWLEEAILEKIVRDKRRSKSQKEVKG
jgi:predicted HicB family RNase H-like nuclease